MLYKENKTNIYSVSPFTITCEKGNEPNKPFTFSNMMDTDRTYYYLKGGIGNVRVNRYDRNSEYGYTSRFENICETETFYLEKINVIPTFENNGIMTIMFCDMMLAILNREMAYYNNIEIKLVNISDKYKDGKIVNVYKGVLPSYHLNSKKLENSRMVLENLKFNRLINSEYYQDIYYLFPLKNRKADIEYYDKLRELKINQLDVAHIKKLQEMAWIFNKEDLNNINKQQVLSKFKMRIVSTMEV